MTDRLENLAGDDDPVTDAVFAAIPSEQVNTRFVDGFEGYTEDTTTALIDVVETGELKVCSHKHAYWVFFKGSGKLTARFLALGNVDVNLAAGEDNRTALHHAASSGFVDVVKVLMDHEDVDATLEDGNGA